MNVFFIDWVGIGFSNNGEPTNADLCVLWSDWKGEIKFEVIFRLGSLILLNICRYLCRDANSPAIFIPRGIGDCNFSFLGDPGI